MPNVERIRRRQWSIRDALAVGQRDRTAVKRQHCAAGAKSANIARDAVAVTDYKAGASAPVLTEFIVRVRINVPDFLAGEVVGARTQELIAGESVSICVRRISWDR